VCLNCAIEIIMDVEHAPDDWREQIEWPEITPEMAEGVLLIRRLYNESTGLGQFTGTPLHTYLDDYNCEDEVLRANEARMDAGDLSEIWATPETQPVEEAMKVGRRILEISWPLTEKQRVAMVSCAHDNVPPLPA
jgi:hypothetical protein